MADTTGPASLVQQGFDDQRGYSKEAFDLAFDFLEQLADYTGKLNIPTLTLDWPEIDTPPSDFTAPTTPTEPDLSADFPALPSDFVLGDIRVLSVGTAPTFTESDPVINLPAPPSAVSLGSLPTAPTINTDFDYPVEPDFTLPDVPTLEDITLPAEPTIILPTFSAVAPDGSDIVVPGLTFTFTEDEYSDSCVLEAVQSKLCTTLTTGGTGLNPDVEQAIWDRERNREDQAALRTRNELLSDYSSRGFSLPTGIEAARLQEAAQEAQNKIISLSRDVAIKQAELEQSNVQHAITSAIQLEQVLISYHNDKMQRAFEVARYAQEAAISIFNAQVQKLNVEVEIYKMAAQVYEIQIRAELAKLEVFKAQLDAQKLISDINVQYIQIYSARVDALRATAEFYRTTMEAVKTRLEGEAIKIDTYRGEIEGYRAQLEAKKTEYDIYVAQIDAELAKVKVFDSKVSAFASRVQAYSSQIDASAKVSDTDIARERMRLETYLGTLDGVLKQSDLESTRIKTLADAYDSQVRAYLGQGDMEKLRHDSDMAVFTAELEHAKAQSEVTLQQGRLEVERLISVASLYIETVKAGAMVSAEVAAAALSAVNLSAGISGSDSTSTSTNINIEGN